MDFGGTALLKEKVDFQSSFDVFNEECTIQFMIDSINSDLDTVLKPREVYQLKIQELGQIDTMNKYNLLNVYRLHINEHDVLKKNLEYLMKLR